MADNLLKIPKRDKATEARIALDKEFRGTPARILPEMQSQGLDKLIPSHITPKTIRKSTLVDRFRSGLDNTLESLRQQPLSRMLDIVGASPVTAAQRTLIHGENPLEVLGPDNAGVPFTSIMKKAAGEVAPVYKFPFSIDDYSSGIQKYTPNPKSDWDMPYKLDNQNTLDLLNPNIDDLATAIGSLGQPHRSILVNQFKNNNQLLSSNNSEEMLREVSSRMPQDYKYYFDRTPFDAIRTSEGNWIAPSSQRDSFGPSFYDSKKGLIDRRLSESLKREVTPLGDLGESWTREELNKYGRGNPGMEVIMNNYNSIPQAIVYRDSIGNPIAVVKGYRNIENKNAIDISTLAADKSKGLAYGRAVKKILTKYGEFGELKPYGTISSDTINLLKKSGLFKAE